MAQVNLGEPEGWMLDYAAPSGHALKRGAYLNAQRYPFEQASVPGLSVSGNGAGCNTLTGQFNILSLIAGSTSSLSEFAADFKQNCEGGSAALFGSIRINAVLTQLSVTNAVVSDGAATFSVTVNPPAAKTVEAFYTTVDGTAKAGVDYRAQSGTIQIPAGKLQATIRVPLIATPPQGRVFYCTITPTSLPPVWIPTGAARL